MMRLSISAVVVLSLSVLGCQRHQADRAFCESVIDAIVAIDLQHHGYRDPVLVQEKQQQMRRQFHARIDECVGKSISASAETCVQNATTIAELNHRCLR